ncbi:EAL domain-containing protein [Ewingella americana]|jgi:sensor c-di-GMP phosphodiesterase-like protein|uniref:EAL domain-containing protein n=1 Tax=Ewingella americana TaxID=41202 RepID=UPI0012ADF980|nr:EAL domain-containing protein [Ewingella americana]MRT05013.1 EAL domain-containing protein [Ewingella americana]
MPFSPIALAKYRSYRVAFAVAIGLFALIMTLGIRICEQSRAVSLNQQRLANHTVEKLENLLQPATKVSFSDFTATGTSCARQQIALQHAVARIQTLRAIALVVNGKIVCSSLAGALDLDFDQMLPELALGNKHVQLRHSIMTPESIPTLVQWQPADTDNRNGVLFVYNIGILANFLLEPQPPYANRVVLNVLNQSLEYDKNRIVPRSKLGKDEVVQAYSTHNEFSISLYGDDAATIAWGDLPAHLPLSLLISLLVAIATYLLSASRISLGYPISHAMSNREFQVYCQPIINSSNGNCVGVETLMRWKNRRQEWVSPDLFIPLAEQHGLIIPLTRYLLRQVSENLSMFPARQDFYISVNVAAQHFHNMEIIDDVRDLWLSAKPEVSLMLELTERTRLQELSAQQIAKLKAMGVMLAIDDFGTGHSSLSYLKTLNPDVLKIDRAFTASIGTDAINATVTDTIITLAHRLKLKLIAEGVETLEQANYLRERQVDSLQGFYFARPMPIDIFPQWLERYEQNNQLAPPFSF